MYDKIHQESQRFVMDLYQACRCQTEIDFFLAFGLALQKYICIEFVQYLCTSMLYTLLKDVGKGVGCVLWIPLCILYTINDTQNKDSNGSAYSSLTPLRV